MARGTRHAGHRLADATRQPVPTQTPSRAKRRLPSSRTVGSAALWSGMVYVYVRNDATGQHLGVSEIFSALTPSSGLPGIPCPVLPFLMPDFWRGDIRPCALSEVWCVEWVGGRRGDVEHRGACGGPRYSLSLSVSLSLSLSLSLSFRLRDLCVCLHRDVDAGRGPRRPAAQLGHVRAGAARRQSHPHGTTARARVSLSLSVSVSHCFSPSLSLPLPPAPSARATAKLGVRCTSRWAASRSTTRAPRPVTPAHSPP